MSMHAAMAKMIQIAKKVWTNSRQTDGFSALYSREEKENYLHLYLNTRLVVRGCSHCIFYKLFYTSA